MEGYMSHLKPGNFPKKRPLKLVEPSLPKRSRQRKRKRNRRYYAVARKYEFYFRVAKQYFMNERSE